MRQLIVEREHGPNHAGQYSVHIVINGVITYCGWRPSMFFTRYQLYLNRAANHEAWQFDLWAGNRPPCEHAAQVQKLTDANT